MTTASSPYILKFFLTGSSNTAYPRPGYTAQLSSDEVTAPLDIAYIRMTQDYKVCIVLVNGDAVHADFVEKSTGKRIPATQFWNDLFQTPVWMAGTGTTYSPAPMPISIGTNPLPSNWWWDGVELNNVQICFKEVSNPRRMRPILKFDKLKNATSFIEKGIFNAELVQELVIPITYDSPVLLNQFLTEFKNKTAPWWIDRKEMEVMRNVEALGELYRDIRAHIIADTLHISRNEFDVSISFIGIHYHLPAATITL